MRSLLLAGLLALALLLGIVPAAQAAPADWAGSRAITAGEVDTPSTPIHAVFVRRYNHTSPATRRVMATTTVAAPAGLPAGCTADVGATSVTPPPTGDDHVTTATLTTTCNGRYAYTVRATFQTRSCVLGQCGSWSGAADTFTVDGAIDVAAPAPAVSGASATPGSGRTVAVSWDPVTDPPPDFRGYRVDRVSANGITTTLATIDDPAATTYTDAAPPAEGGSTTYTVYGRRGGPTGEVASAPASASADVPTAPGSPGPDPGAGGGGGGGTGTGGGGDGTGGGGSGGGGSSGGGTRGEIRLGGGQRPGLSTPTFRVPRVGTPSRSFFPPLLAPPEEGFDERLPYEDEEPGEAEAVPPGDLASGPFEAGPGRGILIPVATGLVLAAWALHLRALGRLARPQYVEVGEDPLEVLY